MRALSDEFARLADVATPGPWRRACRGVHLFDDKTDSGATYMASVTIGLKAKEVGKSPTIDDAKFVAFCGTNRAEITRWLRIAAVVLNRAEAEALYLPNVYHTPCRTIIALADEAKP